MREAPTFRMPDGFAEAMDTALQELAEANRAFAAAAAAEFDKARPRILQTLKAYRTDERMKVLARLMAQAQRNRQKPRRRKAA